MSFLLYPTVLNLIQFGQKSPSGSIYHNNAMGTPPDYGKWHHFVIDVGSDTKLFALTIDGVASTPVAVEMPLATGITMGLHTDSGTPGDAYRTLFDNVVCDVRK